MARALERVQTKGVFPALLKWPKFSLTAYTLVSRMKRVGVAPRTVIDVGANVGQFAVAASKLFGGAAVFPVEPDPRIADLLRGNLDPITRENVIVMAIGDSEGVAELYVNRDSGASSLLPLGAGRIESFPDSKVLGTSRVPLSTLDTLFGGKSLGPPILLKIDVQGFEDRVIAGAGKLLERVQWVLMEVSFSRLYEGERDFETIYEMMKTLGFRFVRPLDFHISPKTGDIIEMDALFERQCSSLAAPLSVADPARPSGRIA